MDSMKVFRHYIYVLYKYLYSTSAVGGNTVHAMNTDQPEFKSADIVDFGPSVLYVDERDAMMELMGRKAQCRCA